MHISDFAFISLTRGIALFGPGKTDEFYNSILKCEELAIDLSSSDDVVLFFYYIEDYDIKTKLGMD